MPRELSLTPTDRAWLKAMDRAMQPSESQEIELPKPVVSMEQYCALVDYADKVTRENYLLRAQRKRMFRLLRGLKKHRDMWRAIAWATGLVFAYVLELKFF